MALRDLERQSRAFDVAASTGDDRENLLSFSGQQAFWPASGRVPEGLSCADDVVDPRLQGSGNGKVVHRCCDNDFVGFDEFGNQFVRDREWLPVVLVVIFRRSEGSGNPIKVNKCERGFGQVTLDDPATEILPFPRLDSGVTELTRNRVVSARTDTDMK